MDNMTAVANNTMITQIIDLLHLHPNTTNSNSTTPHGNTLKNSNKTLPLIFICGAAFVIFLCCIIAKSKKNKKSDDSSDIEDSYNWDSMDDSGRVPRTRGENMLEHKDICHDHRSHYKYQPQLHSGHYDLNRKDLNHKVGQGYGKVDTGKGTV